ncbi:hypothetical protein N566_17000 [Streptomycetaceae bacterium MP113-05]|nr:hypothetical protein N566_17000 [Streptomycetaceae bacterium MP113-05]
MRRRDALDQQETTSVPGATHGADGVPEPVAIVGISALYPGAHTVEDFWRSLTDEAPPVRPREDESRRLDDVEVEVASFGIPPVQARSIARMQLLMLEAARRCLGDAGDSLPRDRTDVVVGTCFGLDRQYANALRVEGRRYARQLEDVAVASGAGGLPEEHASRAAEQFEAVLRRRLGASSHDRVGEMASTIPARIATACRLRGRTLALEAGDATSFLGIAHAIDSLRGGLSDAALVLAGQQEEGRFPAHALAGKGLSAEDTHPFDPDGKGFTLGAGVGGLLLKRLSTAVRDGDRVYATILDCSLDHDPRPGAFRYSVSTERHSEVVAAAYRRAGVPVPSIGYVECAGLGVGAVNRTEIDGLTRVFRDAVPSAPATSVAIGSARDRLDHTFANAGLASVSKLALALHHRTLPPLRQHGASASPDLSGTPLRVSATAEHWPGPPDGTPRRAAVNGTSLTGTICHLVLEEAAPAVPARPAARFRTFSRDPVAIVGYGGSFAGAADAESFWATTMSGEDQIGPLPETLFDRSLYHSPGHMRPNHSYTDLGAPVVAPAYPPDGLSIPPSRHRTMDAAQRLALTVAAEMFTRHRPEPGPLPGQGVVAVGSNLGLTRERRLNTELCIEEFEVAVRETEIFGALPGQAVDALLELVRKSRGEAETADGPAVLDGALASGVSAVIANEYGLRATPVAVEAACASTLAALDVAVSRLRSGSVDYAVAGGVELPCNPRDMALCSALGLLSHDRITPFGLEADGFTPGDGCGLFLLRRYEDARRNGETVYGLLRGVGASNDAKSLIAPDVSGQARAMRQSFAQVDFDPLAVGYLEAHGTGTRVGDRVEIDAVADVYADPRRRQQLEIGSAKSFFGHTFAAAGAAGLLRALLAMRNGTIPPNANLRQINPDLGLTRIPATVRAEAADWKSTDGRPRRAAVSSFGTGGINYHLLLEEHTDGPR